MSIDSTASIAAAGWRLEHSYKRLPSLFYAAVAPTPVREPRLIQLNRGLAASMGLDPGILASAEFSAVFTGNRLPDGAEPIAQAYAGHQFGYFTVLGDGRAILLGEQMTPEGKRVDVQLKGSGPTPFSRRGDGRAALGPMLREYIISEAMHALGIPTTRSLAVASTGETVWRETGLPGAVLVRVAASHIRVGTFELAAASGDPAAITALLDYTIARHFPECASAENPAYAMFQAVVGRQAALIAKWMLVGFVHGVMNTDNMALSGETIDYGPCAFMDAYDPATVFSSIDRQGRYAFVNQPGIAQWNLARLAETLLPLFNPEEAKAVDMAEKGLHDFVTQLREHWDKGMRHKLGLSSEEAGDTALIEALLGIMQRTGADYTNTFAAFAAGDDGSGRPMPGGLEKDPGFVHWKSQWEERLKRDGVSLEESMRLRRAASPAFIPRNHLVEAALAAATEGDLSVMERLLEVLAAPYDYGKSAPEYREPAPACGTRYQTFCGT